MRKTAITTVTLGTMLVLPACNVAGASELPYECERPPAQAHFIDLTDSGVDERLVEERLAAVESAAERVADCEGRLTVVAYGASAASRDVLFDDELRTEGATEIARDKRIPGLVDDVVDNVAAALEGAFGTIESDTSDPLAVFTLVGDWFAEVDGENAPEVVIHSDMIATSGLLVVNEPEPDVEAVLDVVAGLSLPDLSGVSVSITGVGVVSGPDQPPTDFVETVRTIATELCEATGATCEVTT